MAVYAFYHAETRVILFLTSSEPSASSGFAWVEVPSDFNLASEGNSEHWKFDGDFANKIPATKEEWEAANTSPSKKQLTSAINEIVDKGPSELRLAAYFKALKDAFCP